MDAEVENEDGGGNGNGRGRRKKRVQQTDAHEVTSAAQLRSKLRRASRRYGRSIKQYEAAKERWIAAKEHLRHCMTDLRVRECDNPRCDAVEVAEDSTQFLPEGWIGCGICDIGDMRCWHKFCSTRCRDRALESAELEDFEDEEAGMSQFLRELLLARGSADLGCLEIFDHPDDIVATPHHDRNGARDL